MVVPPATATAPATERNKRKRLSDRFAEAWYLDEQGRSEAAIDCLRRALLAAPEYANAMFNLALLLQRSNQHKEAAEPVSRFGVVEEATFFVLWCNRLFCRTDFDSEKKIHLLR